MDPSVRRPAVFAPLRRSVANATQVAVEESPGPAPRLAASPTSATQLLHRRAVAFLVELTAVNVFVLPVVWVLLGDQLTGDAGSLGVLGKIRFDLATPLPLGAFLVARDLAFGGTSPGKRLVGLRVCATKGTDESQSQPTAMNRVLRNASLLLTPLFWIVEYSVAKNDGRRRRLGDKLAQTMVVDANRAMANKRWGVAFAVAIIGTGLLRSQLTPAVYEMLSRIFG